MRVPPDQALKVTRAQYKPIAATEVQRTGASGAPVRSLLAGVASGESPG